MTRRAAPNGEGGWETSDITSKWEVAQARRSWRSFSRTLSLPGFLINDLTLNELSMLCPLHDEVVGHLGHNKRWQRGKGLIEKLESAPEELLADPWPFILPLLLTSSWKTISIDSICPSHVPLHGSIEFQHGLRSIWVPWDEIGPLQKTGEWPRDGKLCLPSPEKRDPRDFFTSSYFLAI